jgi:hypothetical protein
MEVSAAKPWAPTVTLLRGRRYKLQAYFTLGPGNDNTDQLSPGNQGIELNAEGTAVTPDPGGADRYFGPDPDNGPLYLKAKTTDVMVNFHDYKGVLSWMEVENIRGPVSTTKLLWGRRYALQAPYTNVMEGANSPNLTLPWKGVEVSEDGNSVSIAGTGVDRHAQMEGPKTIGLLVRPVKLVWNGYPGRLGWWELEEARGPELTSLLLVNRRHTLQGGYTIGLNDTSPFISLPGRGVAVKWENGVATLETDAEGEGRSFTKDGMTLSANVTNVKVEFAGYKGTISWSDLVEMRGPRATTPLLQGRRYGMQTRSAANTFDGSNYVSPNLYGVSVVDENNLTLDEATEAVFSLSDTTLTARVSRVQFDPGAYPGPVCINDLECASGPGPFTTNLLVGHTYTLANGGSFTVAPGGACVPMQVPLSGVAAGLQCELNQAACSDSSECAPTVCSAQPVCNAGTCVTGLTGCAAVANAGPDQGVAIGEPVILDGQGSMGDAFSWTQVAGPSVTLAGADSSVAGFTAPAVTQPTELTFSLAVSLGAGSSTDVVTILVMPAGVRDVTSMGQPVATASSASIDVIHDGDRPDVGTDAPARQFTTTANSAKTEDWVGYQYATARAFSGVIFQEGMHFANGGWWQTLTVQVRKNGSWVTVSNLQVGPGYPASNNGVSFETYRITFDPIVGDGVRLYGVPGGSGRFVSIAELHAFAADAPRAYADMDQVVEAGSEVTLEGRGSTAPGGGALSYAWTQIGEPHVQLTGANTANPTFTAPMVSSTVDLTFSLVVSSGGTSSPPDQVNVTVLRPGERDVTLAGLPYSVIAETPQLGVMFDGERPATAETDRSLQYDTDDGDATRAADYVGYLFERPMAFSRISFQEGLNSAAGGWFQNLKVYVRQGTDLVEVTGLQSTPPYPGTNNGINFETYRLDFAPISGEGIIIKGPAGGTSHYVSVAELRVYAIDLPQARAGSDQVIALDTTNFVGLNGRRSYSPRGNALQYQWTQIGGPPVLLSAGDTAQPAFLATPVARATDYTFSLVVTDGMLVSEPDAVTVTLLRPDERDVTADANGFEALVTTPSRPNSPTLEALRDYIFPDSDNTDLSLQYDTDTGDPMRTEDWLGYRFPTKVSFSRLVFQAGALFDDGGWFENWKVQVRQGLFWFDVPATATPAYDPVNPIPYGVYKFDFAPIEGTAIRLVGAPGGTGHFISAAELRAFGVPIAPPPPTSLLVKVKRSNGQPLADATVLVYGLGGTGLEGTTNEDGEAQFTVPSGDTYSARVDWLGFTSFSTAVCQVPGCTINVTAGELVVTVKHSIAGRTPFFPLPTLEMHRGRHAGPSIPTEISGTKAIGTIGVPTSDFYEVHVVWLGKHYTTGLRTGTAPLEIEVADLKVSVENRSWARAQSGLLVEALDDLDNVVGEARTDNKGQARIAMPPAGLFRFRYRKTNVNKVFFNEPFRNCNGGATPAAIEADHKACQQCDLSSPSPPPGAPPSCRDVRIVQSNFRRENDFCGGDKGVHWSDTAGGDLRYRDFWRLDDGSCDIDRANRYKNEVGINAAFVTGWNGFGRFDPCDLATPMGRTISAIAFLEHYQTAFHDLKGKFPEGRPMTYASQHWDQMFPAKGYNYIKRMGYLQPSCTRDPSYTAYTTFCDTLDPRLCTTLYLDFFEESIVDRATTLIHEARHHDLKHHVRCNGFFSGPWCDFSFDKEGVFEGTSENGAYAYSARYLWDWAYGCASLDECTQDEQNAAVQTAQTILDTRFVHKPYLTIHVPPK